MERISQIATRQSTQPFANRSLSPSFQPQHPSRSFQSRDQLATHHPLPSHDIHSSNSHHFHHLDNYHSARSSLECIHPTPSAQLLQAAASASPSLQTLPHKPNTRQDHNITIHHSIDKTFIQIPEAETCIDSFKASLQLAADLRSKGTKDVVVIGAFNNSDDASSDFPLVEYNENTESFVNRVLRERFKQQRQRRGQEQAENQSTTSNNNHTDAYTASQAHVVGGVNFDLMAESIPAVIDKDAWENLVEEVLDQFITASEPKWIQDTACRTISGLAEAAFSSLERPLIPLCSGNTNRQKNFNKTSVRLGSNLPGGYSSFADVITDGCSYVDKSLFIAEVLTTRFKVNLILRPRRFGKSLNLSMLSSFFDITGSFGRHPVITLDLKQLRSALTWDEMVDSIRNLLSKTYSHFHCLLQSTCLKPHEKELFNRIMSNDETVRKAQLQDSLMMLSAYLTSYYKKSCVVLIDEYDVPLESACQNGFFKEARAFFGGLFSALLKGNDANIFKAVLVGVLRVSESDFLSGLNNLMGDNIIATWYNGYQSNDVFLYNPWSVICLCAEGTIRNYWNDSGGTATIKTLLKSRTPAFKENALMLMSWNPTYITINDSLRYDDLDQTANDTDVWTLLYYAGYLGLNNDGMFRIPNMEVYSEWVAWLLPKIGEQAVMSSLVESLLGGNVQGFSINLPKTIMESFSYFDVGGSNSGKKAEAFYHAFCLGLFITARDRKYEVKSNHEGGTGRYNIKMMPTTQISTSVGVIIEFKVVGENEDLQDVAFTGLKQVCEKEYRADCPQELKTLCEYGISFKGKNCYVVGERREKDLEGMWRKI
ncbi:hypothetical protein BDR26DRAFT_1010893 [Obelidium mucronatum]|nr:hypothetical protein BDR26DRAFT_1010893 [Obelidium mucronatum]